MTSSASEQAVARRHHRKGLEGMVNRPSVLDRRVAEPSLSNDVPSRASQIADLVRGDGGAKARVDGFHSLALATMTLASESVGPEYLEFDVDRAGALAKTLNRETSNPAQAIRILASAIARICLQIGRSSE